MVINEIMELIDKYKLLNNNGIIVLEYSLDKLEDNYDNFIIAYLKIQLCTLHFVYNIFNAIGFYSC